MLFQLRVAVPAPGVEFGPEGINAAEVLFTAMDRKGSTPFPALNCTHIPIEVSGDFLPRLKTFLSRCTRSAVAG
jgi:hypothetical protein